MSDRRQALLCRYFAAAIKMGIPEYLCIKAHRVWVEGAKSEYDFKVLDRFHSAVEECT
jgi:hypothetical protein